jgi:DHA2 family multidrug resistance protein
VVGRTVDRVDPRLFVTGAFATFALVMFMRARFATSADFTTLAIPTLVQGAAMAMFFLPLITLALSGLPPERIASASGLFNFARLLAGSFGTSISTTFWDRRATLHHAQLVEHVTRFDAQTQQALAILQASGMSAAQSLAAVNRLIVQQAFMLSANDMFYASALLFLALIGIVWLARPAARTPGHGPAVIAAD